MEPRHLIVVGLLMAVTTFPLDVSAKDVALAEALFREGKALMEAKRYKTACPKLAESQRLDPGTGTLLALAVCHKREGKTASAWAEFNEVVAASRRDRRKDRETFARKEATKLERELSRLEIAIDATTAELEGLEVMLDGVVLGSAAWNSPSPVDPGTHEVVATVADGRRFVQSVLVKKGGDRRRVELVFPEPPPTPDAPPVVEPSESAASSEPPASPAVVDEPFGTQRTISVIVGAVGIVGIGLGAIYGVLALSKNAEAESLCNPAACTEPSAIELSQTAHDFALVSNVSFVAGAVGLGVATALFLTAPKSGSSSRAVLAPILGARQGGLSVFGTF